MNVELRRKRRADREKLNREVAELRARDEVRHEAHLESTKRFHRFRIHREHCEGCLRGDYYLRPSVLCATGQRLWEVYVQATVRENRMSREEASRV